MSFFRAPSRGSFALAFWRATPSRPAYIVSVERLLTTPLSLFALGGFQTLRLGLKTPTGLLKATNRLEEAEPLERGAALTRFC